jgi:hypothetical protein
MNKNEWDTRFTSVMAATGAAIRPPSLSLLDSKLEGLLRIQRIGTVLFLIFPSCFLLLPVVFPPLILASDSNLVAAVPLSQFWIRIRCGYD